MIYAGISIGRSWCYHPSSYTKIKPRYTIKPTTVDSTKYCGYVLRLKESTRLSQGTTHGVFLPVIRERSITRYTEKLLSFESNPFVRVFNGVSVFFFFFFSIFTPKRIGIYSTFIFKLIVAGDKSIFHSFSNVY